MSFLPALINQLSHLQVVRSHALDAVLVLTQTPLVSFSIGLSCILYLCFKILWQDFESRFRLEMLLWIFFFADFKLHICLLLFDTGFSGLHIDFSISACRSIVCIKWTPVDFCIHANYSNAIEVHPARKQIFSGGNYYILMQWRYDPKLENSTR